MDEFCHPEADTARWKRTLVELAGAACGNRSHDPRYRRKLVRVRWLEYTRAAQRERVAELLDRTDVLLNRLSSGQGALSSGQGALSSALRRQTSAAGLKDNATLSEYESIRILEHEASDFGSATGISVSNNGTLIMSECAAVWHGRQPAPLLQSRFKNMTTTSDAAATDDEFAGAWPGTPIRDTRCRFHPLTGVPCLRPGPRRSEL